MTNVLNVIVTCTKDKRVPTPKECQLRAVPGTSIRERIQEWQARTNRHWKESVPASALYAGDHWATVLALESSFFEIEIWVCSAGFGLIHLNDRVPSYSATFSRNHPDSVDSQLSETDRLTGKQNWWQATATKWKQRFGERPRTLNALMSENPKQSFLVVASDNYMRAIADDLREGVSQLADPDQLTIVCAGAKRIEGLDQNLIPCDARMQKSLGGARRSLNIRLASKIIREARQTPRAKNLRKHYKKLLSEQPPIETHNRQQITDEAVKTFIQNHLRINPNTQHSPMLRALRDSNMACEQRRFASLYRQVVEANND